MIIDGETIRSFVAFGIIVAIFVAGFIFSPKGKGMDGGGSSSSKEEKK